VIIGWGIVLLLLFGLSADGRQTESWTLPKCYKKVGFVPNFTSVIPPQAHQHTTTDDNLANWIRSDFSNEPTIASLFAPPGFGKTESTRYAARFAHAVYCRVAASRSPIMLKLSERYDEVLYQRSSTSANVKVDELLKILNDVSYSFVVCLLNAIASIIKESEVYQARTPFRIAYETSSLSFHCSHFGYHFIGVLLCFLYRAF
jgi:hypothetical protein